LNGSFEQNNIVPMGNCMTNISNNDYTNYMHYSTAFSVYGSMESFIYFDSCVTYTGVYAENITQDGNYSVLLGCKDTIENSIYFLQYTAYSLELTQQLMIGSYYKLICYNKTFINIFNKGRVELGVSEVDTSMGVIIDTLEYSNNIWKRNEVIFKVNNNAKFLTMRGFVESGNHGCLVDNFILTLDSFAVLGVNEQAAEKQLLYITDVLGRHSKPTLNVPLFYRYDDGTVEKMIVFE